MAHHEVEELLGAYALDAVDEDEATEVEAHLAECPRCRAEVAEHREVAALLTSGTAAPAPPGIWDKIAEELGDTPPPVPIEVAFGQRTAKSAASSVVRPARRSPLVGLAAAAAVVVIAAMGVVLVNQREDLDAAREQAANQPEDGQLAALLQDPETRVVDLVGEADGTARAFLGPDGDSVLLASGLPDLGAGRTYQLWGLPNNSDEMVSLSVLGAEPHQSSFHIEGSLTALAISREPGGGSTEPTTEPFVTGVVT